MYPRYGPAGNGFLRLHSTYRHDLKIYTSDEGRVQTSAAAFTQGLLDLEGTSLTPILVRYGTSVLLTVYNRRSAGWKIPLYSFAFAAKSASTWKQEHKKDRMETGSGCNGPLTLQLCTFHAVVSVDALFSIKPFLSGYLPFVRPSLYAFLSLPCSPFPFSCSLISCSPSC